MLSGDIAVELVPQGTLIERIRAAGYGLGGILTSTGLGTVVEEGSARSLWTAANTCSRPRCMRTLPWCGLFLQITSAISYALTARNFNPVIAMAGKTVIVDAEHIVPVGMIAPDHVMTPAPIVDYLITGA